MSGDIIKFNAFIKRSNSVVAYVMPIVSNTANVKFKNIIVAHINEKENIDMHINRIETQKVEL